MAYVKQSKPLRVTFSGKLAGDSQRRFRVEFEGGGRYDAPLAKSELGRGIARGLFLRPAAMSPDRARFFEALEHEPFRQVCGRFLSMLQPREKPAARPLKELLHLPWGKKEKK